MASWGALPLAEPRRVIERDWRFEALPELAETDSFLAYGMGRSYGDSCINSQGTQLSTRQLRRLIHFDTERGILRCEAGVTLGDILQLIVPKGWFLPVVPGSRFVTLGGAIANDVHGKNHHSAGTFGCHVRALNLLRSDGTRPRCSLSDNAKLFAATIGGLGLTGLIVDAEIDLLPISSAEMEVENEAFYGIEQFNALSRESADWDYTVSWIDTSARQGHTTRGIFSRARHAKNGSGLSPGRSSSLIKVPFALPWSCVNRWTVGPFNRVYFWAGQRQKGTRFEHYQPFFFPLDSVAQWNRMYGARGFFQYQCVLPPESRDDAISALLRDVRASGQASFLVVLKEFGDRRSPGMLSFPRPGLTLALDFPNRGQTTRHLLDSFDRIVRRAGGAVYPAKDARMSPDMFASAYPAVESFRAQLDPKFSSAFWRRVQASR
ncbi:MAG: FAD-binding oxidoreductase [Halioglobus sp.]|nr:FAD-binding oxidoreductase [Halioglobus sp.]